MCSTVAMKPWARGASGGGWLSGRVAHARSGMEGWGGVAVGLVWGAGKVRGSCRSLPTYWGYPVVASAAKATLPKTSDSSHPTYSSYELVSIPISQLF